MKILYPPNELDTNSVINHKKKLRSIFLAGSIEQDLASNWQEKVVFDLYKEFDVFFNPRRKSWDRNIVQSINNPEFKKQVNWELNYILFNNYQFEHYIIFNFEGNTVSPISLLELGLVSGKKIKNVFVNCSTNYWRKGNVEIICDYSNIPLTSSLDDLITNIKSLIHNNDK